MRKLIGMMAAAAMIACGGGEAAQEPPVESVPASVAPSEAAATVVPALPTVESPTSTPAPDPPVETVAPAPVPPPVPQASMVASGALVVTLTTYACVGAPPDLSDGYCPRVRADGGLWPYDGVAACGSSMRRGQRFTIEGDPSVGKVYVCDDAGYGGAYWIDVWFYDYGCPVRPCAPQPGTALWWRQQLGPQVTVRLE